jgi:hypothetical protein
MFQLGATAVQLFYIYCWVMFSIDLTFTALADVNLWFVHGTGKIYCWCITSHSLLRYMVFFPTSCED